ncbi:MAG TPA: winged helix-turn-helix domain-containing protein [Streptosporangiaceae bacterium]|nr:winged helix-turn-helix domain-containing protein [Streptosporangiaceae bacterium]
MTSTGGLPKAWTAANSSAARSMKNQVASLARLHPVDRLLDLSVKEFGVLEALLRASPAFLSAEELLEQVWDEHADPFTNTVTVTIGRLRRKLGDSPVITTTPSVGYRIVGPTA